MIGPNRSQPHIPYPPTHGACLPAVTTSGVPEGYLLTCWSDENADELFLDVVCDGGHDAPIGEGNGARLHVELIVTRSSPNVMVRGSSTRNNQQTANSIYKYVALHQLVVRERGGGSGNENGEHAGPQRAAPAPHEIWRDATAACSACKLLVKTCNKYK